MQYRLSRDKDAVDLLDKNRVDLAFIGDDKIEEWTDSGNIQSVEVADRVLTSSQFVLAGLATKAWEIPTQLGRGELLTVATSYPAVLAKFAVQNGLNLAVAVTPKGSCEAYVTAGDADLTFDIRSTGRTLKENGLVVYREGRTIKLNVCTNVTVCPVENVPLELSLQNITDTLLRRSIQAREGTAPASSFTARLFQDRNALKKKCFEEFGEFDDACLTGTRAQLIGEGTDLLTVMQVRLLKRGIGLVDVLKECVRRNKEKG